jgi:hypothetical protein
LNYLRLVWRAVRRALHQFITWVFPALFAGVIGLATAFADETKPWFIATARTVWLWATLNQIWAIAAIIVGVAIWLAAYLLTAEEERPPLGSLNDLQPDMQLNGAGVVVSEGTLSQPSTGTGPPLSVQDATSHSEATSPMLSGSLTIENRLYVGMVIVSAGSLESAGYIELAIRAFNGADVPLRVATIGGHVRGGIGNADGTDLPPVEWQHAFNTEPVPTFTEFMVVLHQPLDDETAQAYLHAFDTDYVALDLRNLDIEMRTLDEERHARLPLWDGVSLRRRDDIFTGRIIMMTLSDTVSVTPSLS